MKNSVILRCIDALLAKSVPPEMGVKPRSFAFFWMNVTALFLLTLAQPAQSQRYVGIATSNWGAINSVYLNPANIADCREKFSINVLSLNIGLDNNLGLIPKIPDFNNAVNRADQIFAHTRKTEFSMMAPAAVVRGPGIMVSVSKKISLALTTDIRGINQFNNFDPALFKFMSQLGIPPTGNYSAKLRNFNWTAHLWSEIGLTFGAVISENEKQRLNFGITVRRLGGIGYVSIAGKYLELNYRQDSNTFSASHSDIAFSSNLNNDSSAELKDITPSGLLQKFFGETAGGGMGGDIGVTYRYRFGTPEVSDYMESNLIHDLVFSAAITDIGAITYYNSANAIINITGSGNLTSQEIQNNVGSVASIVDYAHRHGFVVDTATKPRRVYLPVAMALSCDYQLHGRFFANLLFVCNLANRLNFGNSYYNQLSFTPRYDFHKMTIALPITYSALAQDLKLGFAVRYRAIYLGSDDFMAVLNKYQYGFDFYLGAYIPIFKTNRDPLGLHWGI